MLENESFTIPKASKDEMLEYEIRNDSVQAFILDDSPIENQTTRAVYSSYCEFCLREGMQPISNIELSRQIKRKLNLDISRRTIQGEKVKLYTKNNIN